MRYHIYSGDPDGAFSIDPESGEISTAGRLDHEQHSSVLLNVQAVSGQPPTFGHSQVSPVPSGRLSIHGERAGWERRSEGQSVRA